MPLSFLLSEETRAERLYRQSLANIYDKSLDRDLGEYLVHSCAEIKSLPSIVDTFVVATDEEGELYLHTSATSSAESDEGFQIQHKYRELTQQVKTDRGWQIVQVESLTGTYSYAHTLSHADQSYGMLFVSSDRPRDEINFAFRAIRSLLPHLAGHIANTLAQEENRLNRRLNELASKHLIRRLPMPDSIVAELKVIFCATEVTLFLKEDKELLLAATTRQDLFAKAKDFKPEPGLVSYLLSQDNALRIFDTTDPSSNPPNISPPHGTEHPTAAPFFAPDSPLKSTPHHYLATPTISSHPDDSALDLEYAGPTAHRNGVLQLTRSNRPFLSFEERALKHFAALLGSNLSHAWRIFVADHLWSAETEAFAISRHEPRKKKTSKGVSRLVAFDSAAKKLFGGNTEELRGIDVRELFEEGTFEGHAVRMMEAIHNKKEAYGPIEINVRKLDGTIIPTESSYRLFPNPFLQKRINFIASLLRDTSKRQEALQEKEKIVAQHSRLVELLAERGLAYFAADEHGVTSETSPAEQRITGYTEEELLKMQRRQLYADSARQQTTFYRLREKRGQIVRLLQDLKKKGGTSMKANCILRLLKDSQGQPSGYEGLYEEATDKIRLQELLDLDTDRVIDDSELYEQLRENTKLNLDYMTSLSHQLRTPLGALTHNLQDLKNSLPKNDSRHKQLDYLQGQTRVCNMLAKNLSYIDRILKGEEFERVPMNLEEMIMQTYLNFKHMLRTKHLKYSVDRAEVARRLSGFTGSQELFRQVLVNLMDNAIKYSKEGTTINVTAGPGIYERHLEISNIGIPIPHGQLKSIFDRGFRNRHATAFADGTGLGLWIAKKIVEQHEGTISCISSLDSRNKPLHLITFKISLKESNFGITGPSQATNDSPTGH